ncbi:hypothetical protein D3C80_1153690 [compost metagenome]
MSVAFASPDPVNFGLASSVSEPAVIAPFKAPTSSSTLFKTGLIGGVVSLVPIISRTSDLFPALSIADTDACLLSVKAGEIEIVNFPSAPAVPLPMTLPLKSLTSIFALASAVPVTVVPSALI